MKMNKKRPEMFHLKNQAKFVPLILWAPTVPIDAQINGVDILNKTTKVFEKRFSLILSANFIIFILLHLVHNNFDEIV